MVTLDDPPKLMADFHRSNRELFRVGEALPSFEAVAFESILERILIHFLELQPVDIRATLNLTQAVESFRKAPHGRDQQLALIQSLHGALDTVIEPEVSHIDGIPISFARPGYAFLSSRKLRTFFPNLNDGLCDPKKYPGMLDRYTERVTSAVKELKCNRLGFIEKSFGPVGAIELRAELSRAVEIPSVVYRAYSWKRHNQPISAGRISSGDTICAVYDVGITGGLISEFAEYAKSRGANVVAAIVSFDYDEGAREYLDQQSVEYFPLVRKHRVINQIAQTYESLFKSEFLEYPDPADYPEAKPRNGKPDLEARFEELGRQWSEEASYHSNPDFVRNNAPYRELLQMGDAIIPYVIRKIEIRPLPWLHLLYDLAPENPTQPQDSGNIYLIRHRWIEWARKKRYFEYASHAVAAID